MNLMNGKKGIIFGVSNKFGIANAIAEQLYGQGADIAFTYASEVMEKRVRPIAESMNTKMCVECDVTDDNSVFESDWSITLESVLSMDVSGMTS